MQRISILFMIFSIETLQAQVSWKQTDEPTGRDIHTFVINSSGDHLAENGIGMNFARVHDIFPNSNYYFQDSNSTQHYLTANTKSTLFKRSVKLFTDFSFQENIYKMASNGYSDYEQGKLDGKLAAGGTRIMLSGVITGVIISSSLSTLSGLIVNFISIDYNIDEKAGRDARKLAIVTPIIGTALSAAISLLIPTNVPDNADYDILNKSNDYKRGFNRGYKRSKRSSRLYSSVLSGAISGSLVMLYAWNYKTHWK